MTRGLRTLLDHLDPQAEEECSQVRVVCLESLPAIENEFQRLIQGLDRLGCPKLDQPVYVN